MSFRFNASGIKDSEYPVIPDGWYPFRIEEAQEGKSKSGFPQVLAKCQCLDPRYRDYGLVWNFITFLPAGRKGAGITVHFLKCIGEPWEGEFDVSPARWVGKKFNAYVVAEEYEGKINNKFKKISPWNEDGAPPEPAQGTQSQHDDEIPF